MQILKPIISSIYSFILPVGLCLSILVISPNSLSAQNLQLPLNEGLKTSSEKLKVTGSSSVGATSPDVSKLVGPLRVWDAAGSSCSAEGAVLGGWPDSVVGCPLQPPGGAWEVPAVGPVPGASLG